MGSITQKVVTMAFSSAVLTAARNVKSGYAGLDSAMGKVSERNLAFLAVLGSEGLSRSVAADALRKAGCNETVCQRFQQFMSDYDIKNDAKGVVAMTGEGTVLHTLPSVKKAAAKAAKEAAGAVAGKGTEVPSGKPDEKAPAEPSKGEVLASTERGLRTASEKLRGMALPASVKTAEQACSWMIEQLKKVA